MTPLEYAMKLDRLIQSLQTENIPFKKAVQTTHALRMTRIFDKGQLSSGGQIGHYSTKPIYVNPKTYGFSFQSKGKVIGEQKSLVVSIKTKKEKLITTKRGKFVGRNVKDRKTRYFAEGYKGFRQFVKRPTNFINLGLTYDMRFDLSNSRSLKRVGLPDKLSPSEYVERFKRPHNAEKFTGLEKRFGDIGDFQNSEREQFNKVLQFELTKFLS